MLYGSKNRMRGSLKMGVSVDVKGREILSMQVTDRG